MKSGKKPVAKIAESMAAAESLWGIAVAEQRRAKAGGCSAFKGSRVFRDGLIAWLKGNPPKPGTGDGDNLRAQKLKVQIALLENQLARERGDLVAKATVTEEWGHWISALFEIIGRHADRDLFNRISAELKAKLGTRAATI
jgi:hypothetical protein